MIVADTSFIFALMASRDRHHVDADAWYLECKDQLVTTPLVLSEADHLIARTGDRTAVGALRADFSRGVYRVKWWSSALAESIRVAEQYSSLQVSITDASLVALASHEGTTAIATFDERHFRAMRPLAAGQAFTVLPADQPR